MTPAEKASAMRARLLEEPALMRRGLTYQPSPTDDDVWTVRFNGAYLGFVRRGANGRWVAMSHLDRPLISVNASLHMHLNATHVQLDGFYATRLEAALCFPSVRQARDWLYEPR